MQQQTNIINDILALAKHVGNTPIFEVDLSPHASTVGKARRRERRKQQTSALINNVKRHLKTSV